MGCGASTMPYTLAIHCTLPDGDVTPFEVKSTDTVLSLKAKIKTKLRVVNGERIAAAVAVIRHPDSSIDNLLGLDTPHSAAVEAACCAALYLMGDQKILASWATFQRVLTNPAAFKGHAKNPEAKRFIHLLRSMDLDNIPNLNVDRARAYINRCAVGLGKTDLATLREESPPAAELAIWVINVIEYSLNLRSKPTDIVIDCCDQDEAVRVRWHLENQFTMEEVGIGNSPHVFVSMNHLWGIPPPQQVKAGA